MSAKKRPDLLSSLHVMDEHWGQVEPNPAFEQRLLLRLQSVSKKNRTHFSLLAWSRQYGRPLVIVFAAAVVLFLSMSDAVPTVRSSLIVPNVPDAAVEPEETPFDERLEPANPHEENNPQNPSNIPMDPTDPPRFDLPLENPRVFPVNPDSEWEQEQTFVQPKDWSLVLRRSAPKSTSREFSDVMHYWTPGQTIPSEMQSRSPNNPGQWGGGGSSRPKPQTTTSPALCYTKETLKKRAAATCEDSGLVLSDIMYINPCKNGLYQYAEHECTEIVPDEESCKTGTVSDGDQCVDPGQLKMLAYTACKMAILDMVEFTYATDDCGWKTRKATYTCCPFPPPEPPPASPPLVCQNETIGDGVTCMDPGKLKEDAYSLCQGLGQMLMDISPLMDCPNGLSTWAKISCCKQ